MRLFFCFFLILALGAGLASCREEQPQTDSSIAATEMTRTPPTPPVWETFESQPRMSLFPRIGDFRPEDGESEALPFWRTFIDHLSRVSGVVDTPLPLGHGRAFALRSIGDLASVGFFAPLAVEPGTGYRVSALIRTDLPPRASAGLGLLEFDAFLWAGEQYTRSVTGKHLTGSKEGVRLQGKNEWRQVAFTIETGPRTRMVHLVLFREGAEGREPVLFDDIRVERE